MKSTNQPSLLEQLVQLGFPRTEAHEFIIELNLTRAKHSQVFRAASHWLTLWFGELNESEHALDLLHALLDRVGMQSEQAQRFNNLLELVGCTPLELDSISFESFVMCAKIVLNRIEKAQAKHAVFEEI